MTDNEKLVALKLGSMSWINRRILLRQLPASSQLRVKKHLYELKAYSRLECTKMLETLLQRNKVAVSPQAPQADGHVQQILAQKLPVTPAVVALAKEYTQP